MATEPTEQHRSDFLFLMMFAHLLPTGQNRTLLEKQTAHLQSELGILERIIDECPTLTPGMRFTLEYGIAANRALLRLMRGRSTALLREIDAARSPTAS
jgi:hypothetical protein